MFIEEVSSRGSTEAKANAASKDDLPVSVSTEGGASGPGVGLEAGGPLVPED